MQDHAAMTSAKGAVLASDVGFDQLHWLALSGWG
jgi:hypothetical protein